MTFEQEKWNIKQYCILDLIALNYLTVLVISAKLSGSS